MAVTYTQGVWQVKAGHAREFVDAWNEFAEWSAANAPGAMWVKLDDDHRFVSIGPWVSADAVDEWRRLEGGGELIGRLRQLLVDFTPATLEPVVELGAQ